MFKMNSDSEIIEDETKSNGFVKSAPVSPYRVRTSLPVQQPGNNKLTHKLDFNS